MKALLKSLIENATSRNEGIDDEDDDQLEQRKGSKLLNYDLDILAGYVRERKLDQVVIVIQDTEAFDSELLSDLIEVLGNWHDRIPFALLFSIATSSNFLQQRLSKAAVKCLQGRLFDVAPSAVEIEQVFEALVGPDAPLWIGPTLMTTIIERQNDYIQSIDSFVDAARYAYMSCYYANALSLFLDTSIELGQVPNDHLEAVRNLKSFRTFCKKLMENGDVDHVRDLLASDDILSHVVQQKVNSGREALADIVAAISVVQQLQHSIQPHQITPKPKLYNQAMSHKLNGSSSLKSLLLSIRKAPSDTTRHTMDVLMAAGLTEDIRERCITLREELADVVKSQTDNNKPLRSEDDLKNSTLRTTVVAQKVELSKQKSTLSKQDATYTAILRRFTDLLEEYFTNKFVDPGQLPFHEIFLYDLKSPHREVFTPRPRQAIERALATPHDYLDCDCCAPGKGDNDEATLAASQPATAVLYQLYLESGSLINASDLWQAFQAVMGDERTDEHNMAVFQRALAELHYVGLVKATRKRVDHVAKVAWKGL